MKVQRYGSFAGLIVLTIAGGMVALQGQTVFTPSGTIGTSSNAFVGIGTSTPAAALDIKQTVGLGSSATLLIVQDSNASRNLPLTYGYKTSNAGSVAALGFNWAFNFGGGGAQRANTTRNGWALVLDDRDSITDGTLVFEQVSSSGVDTKPVAFTATGSVGIGTTAPDARLSVVGGYASIDGYTHVLTKIGSGGAIDIGSINGNAAYIGSTSGSVTGIRFYTNGSMGSAVMQLTNSGSVGIGTTNPDAKLAVNGTIHAKEVIVDTSSAAWSDYVFAPGYRLAPLSEVEQQIKTEGHLPGVPSAAEVAEHGVNVADMQARLLAKIEELTLHVIAQDKQLAAQSARIEKLEAENAGLTRR